MSDIINFLGANKKRDLINSDKTVASIINLINALKTRFDALDLASIMQTLQAHESDRNNPHKVTIDLDNDIPAAVYEVYAQVGGTLAYADFQTKIASNPIWFFELIRRIEMISEYPFWRIPRVTLGGLDATWPLAAPLYFASLQIPDLIGDMNAFSVTAQKWGMHVFNTAQSGTLKKSTTLLDYKINSQVKTLIPANAPSDSFVGEYGYASKYTLQTPDNATVDIVLSPSKNTLVGDTNINITFLTTLLLLNFTLSSQSDNNGGSFNAKTASIFPIAVMTFKSSIDTGGGTTTYTPKDPLPSYLNLLSDGTLQLINDPPTSADGYTGTLPIIATNATTKQTETISCPYTLKYTDGGTLNQLFSIAIDQFLGVRIRNNEMLLYYTFNSVVYYVSITGSFTLAPSDPITTPVPSKNAYVTSSQTTIYGDALPDDQISMLLNTVELG